MTEKVSEKGKGYWFAGLALVMMGMTVVNAQSDSYPDMSYRGPSPMPALPADFKAFDPPVHTDAVNSGSPAISEWIPENQPGDTMVLTGERFTINSGIAEGRDTHFLMYGEGFAPVDGLIQRLDGRQCALTLPADLPPEEMYLLWPCNNNGFGKPVAINQTETWWVGPDEVAKGQAFSVYGRNLSLGDRSCRLYIEELNLWLESTAANPYKADFVLPSNVANGTYTVWAHNGSGQKYGWARQLTLTVKSGLTWNDDPDTWFIVTDYGAKGDGVTDDYSAIKAAMNAANAVSGSTVYFPAGTYNIGANLSHQTSGLTDVRLLGASRNGTVLREHSTFASKWLMIIKFFDCEMADMTIETGAGNASDNALLYLRDSDNLYIQNCKFSQLPNMHYGDTAANTMQDNIIDLANADNVRIENCEFLSAWTLLVQNASQIQFDRCNWKGMNDANSLISLRRVNGFSLVDSTATHYDDQGDLYDTTGSTYCAGRFARGMGESGTLKNLYFGGNGTTNMTPSKAAGVAQNQGEHFMFEKTFALYTGKAVSATANTVTFSDLSKDYRDEIAIIVDGKGVGQARQIIGYSAGKITLSENWTVEPDSGSTISIGKYVHRVALYDNYLDGHARAIDTSGANNTATSGIQPYSGCSEFIAVGNTMHQMRFGIYNCAKGEDTAKAGINSMSPTYFNLFADNIISNSRVGLFLPSKFDAPYDTNPFDEYVGMLANIYRNHTMEDIKESPFYIDVRQDYPFNSMSVYDQNTVKDMVRDLRVKAGAVNQIFVKNTFTSKGSGTGINIEGSELPVFHGNTWNGFSIDYEGSAVGDTLELPVRMVELSANDNVAVWNSGTETLNWTATTDDPWLNIVQASGSIGKESTSEELSVEIIEALAPQSGTEGLVTVTSDSGQTKQIVVEYVTNVSTPPPPDPPPAPVLTGVVISGSTTVDEGTASPYVCTASYSDGSTTQVDPTWSEDSPLAAISGAGVLTSDDLTADESLVITASYGGYTDTHNVTIQYVPAVLTGITIAGPLTVSEETTAQYSCTATYSDGTTAAVSPDWSENSSSATISTSGVLAAGNVASDQSVTITASYGGQSDTHALTVRYVPPVVIGILISGAASLNEGTTEQYICRASYSDGTSAVVTPAWSDNSSYASISGSGLLSAGDVAVDQDITVSANFGGYSDSHAVTINYVTPVLTGITISGPSSISEETAAQYTCTANYSDGTSDVVTPTWAENSAYSTITSSGLLTAGDVSASQSITVSASHDGKSDTHTVTITYTPPSVSGIAISGPGTVGENTTAQYVCTATYSDGSSAQVNPIWTIDSASAAIGGSGLLSAGNITADEQATVQASFSGKVAAQLVQITVVGDQVVLELNGFDGKTVSAELWDDVAQTTVELGEEFEPEEIIIENVNPDQWYWLGLREYDANAGEWVLVHGRWIWM